MNSSKQIKMSEANKKAAAAREALDIIEEISVILVSSLRNNSSSF